MREETKLETLTPLLISCETLGKLLNLFKPQFFFMLNGYKKLLTGFLKSPYKAQSSEPSNFPVSVSCSYDYYRYVNTIQEY